MMIASQIPKRHIVNRGGFDPPRTRHAETISIEQQAGQQ
jgi:hypothetical protein